MLLVTCHDLDPASLPRWAPGYPAFLGTPTPQSHCVKPPPHGHSAMTYDSMLCRVAVVLLTVTASQGQLTYSSPDCIRPILGPGCTSQQYCQRITAGSYQCVDWQDCAAGEYELVVPTLYNDRSCRPCPAGTVGSGAVNAPASSCQACPPGSYIPPGSSGSCVDFLCPIGSVDDDLDAATPCQQCGTGHFFPIAKAGLSAPCNLFECRSLTTDHDYDVTTPCVDCPPTGMFVPARSAGVCANYRCGEGEIDDDRSSRSPCVGVPPGHYTPPQASGDVADYECPAGTTDHDTDASTPCLSLPVGSYAPAKSLGDESPFRCVPGTTDHDLDPATPCITCGPGHELPGFGASGACEAFLCPAGSVDVDSDPTTTCSVCVYGGYVPEGAFGRPCGEFRCPAGLKDHDRDASTPCTACTARPVVKLECKVPLDLVFLLDGSGSVSRTDFARATDFVRTVGASFEISAEATRLGIAQFSSGFKTEFPLNTPLLSDPDGYFCEVDKIYQLNGGTATAEALRSIKDTTLSASQGARLRKAVPKVLVVITDGASNNRAAVPGAAQALKEEGVQVFSIGVGNYVIGELRAMASEPTDKHVFTVQDFGKIADIVDQISQATCRAQTPVTLEDLTESNPLPVDIPAGQYKYFKYTPQPFSSTGPIELVVRSSRGAITAYASYNTENPSATDHEFDFQQLGDKQSLVLTGADTCHAATVPVSALTGDARTAYQAGQDPCDSRMDSLQLPCGAGVGCSFCPTDNRLVCTKCRPLYFSVLASSAAGPGSFELTAVRDTVPSPSRTFTCGHCSLQTECGDCESASGLCRSCLNGTALEQYECVDPEACPANKTVYSPTSGRGQRGHGKRCMEPFVCTRLIAIAGERCDCTKRCIKCEWRAGENRPVCLTCKDSYGLYEGQCLEECPDTHIFSNKRVYGRVCLPKRTNCHLDRNCLDCAENGGRCLACRNGRVLSDGACLTSCPAGQVAWPGVFNRVCLPQDSVCDRLVAAVHGLSGEYSAQALVVLPI